MNRRIFKYIDIPTLTILLSICLIGLSALYSASFQNGALDNDNFFKQIFWIAAGLILFFIMNKVGYRRILSYANILYILNLFILMLVLAVGAERLGAQRWISVFGFNIQPSEISKIVIILFLAKYFSRFYNSCTSGARLPFIQGFIVPLVLVGIMGALIFLQPDLGTAALLLPIFLIMVFYAGFKLRYLLIFLGSITAALPVLWFLMKNYQRARLMVFLNPNLDPLGAGYTIIQSKIAVGSGRFLGKGWISGTQNQLNFLPERHTDFIFSVVGEEWGFFGALILLSLFLALIFRIISFISETSDSQSKLLIVGVATFLFSQVLINIAMTIGLVPVVGIPLPFISYGGSSMIIGFMAVGLASSVRKDKKL